MKINCDTESKGCFPRSLAAILVLISYSRLENKYGRTNDASKILGTQTINKQGTSSKSSKTGTFSDFQKRKEKIRKNQLNMKLFYLLHTT